MVAENIFYVPWADVSEWNTVREQIFSSNVQDTITAYHTILMWKLRYDSVPTYIECTYSILQVMVKEYEMTKNEQNALLFNEFDLRLSYSTALIRFVNHVSSLSSYKGGTLYLAAKTQNIPDWIINMRHDVAHGQDLPSLDVLHIAAELSLKWLLDNYWHSPEICEQKSDASCFDLDLNCFRDLNTDVQNLFIKFFDIWEMCHDTKYNKLQHITETDREFILHVEEMLSMNNVYFSNVENDAAIKIQNVVNVYNQMEENGDFEPTTLYRFKEFQTTLLKFIKNIIKGNDQLKHTFVLSLFMTTFLLETNFNPNKWLKIFWLLQETGSFSFFFEALFQIAGKNHKGASKWLSILPPSIVHLKKMWAIFKVYKNEMNNFQTKLIKRKIKNSCKSTHSNLIVPLEIFKPPNISLEMIKNILLNPEQFSVENIIDYLKLVKPTLMTFTVDMIRDLVSLYLAGSSEESIEEGEEQIDDKVFTVEDLDKVLEIEKNLVFEEAKCDSDGWVRSSIDISVWNKCPLGLLPFQTKVDCSLPNNLSWERISTTRKRVSVPLLKHSASMKKFRQI